MSRRPSVVPLLAVALLGVGSGSVAAQQATAPACAAPLGPAAQPAVPGGGESLTGTQPGPMPPGVPILCWTGASGNAVQGTRALAVGDRILTLTDTGDAVAFAQDGSEAWRVNLAQVGEGLLGGLASDGTLLFVGTPTGLVALSHVDGSTVWTLPIDPGPQRAAAGVYSPIVTGDVVVALVYTSDSRRSISRRLVAVDRSSGSETWSQTLFDRLPAGPPSADDRSVAVAEGDGSLVLRETATGAEQLRVPVSGLGGAPATPIALTRADLIVGLTSGEAVALFRDDGAVRWRFAPGSGRVASVTANGVHAFVNGVTALYALDAANGTPIWDAAVQASPPPFAYQPIPALVDGAVIVGTTDINAPGALLAFDALSGALMWRVDLDLYGALFSPVVTGEWVYVPSFDLIGSGGLLAFGRPG